MLCNCNLCLKTKNRLKWVPPIGTVAMSVAPAETKAQIETDYTRDDADTQEAAVFSCYILSC